MEHELKCWPEFFAPVNDGRKPFELRKDDRPYHVGDFLKLKEFDPKTEAFTGRICRREITYILNGGIFGLNPGYVILGLDNA